MDLQKEVRQLVVRYYFIVVFIVAEHVADDIPHLVFVLLHEHLKDFDYLILLKLLVAILVEICKNCQDLSTDPVSQVVAAEGKWALN